MNRLVTPKNCHRTDQAEARIIETDMRRYFVFSHRDGISLFSRENRCVIFLHGAKSTPMQLIRETEKTLDDILPDAPIVEKRPNSTAHYLQPNVEIILTEKCQMRCAYCFSEANDASHRKTIDWKKAQHGIDLAFRNARLLKSMGNGYEPRVRIGFTGGGEPTVEFKLLIDCLKYVSSQSQELSIPYSCMLQTNGQIEPEGLIELYRNGCQSFALSIDGLQSVQDSQRRRLDGRSSFERCLSFLDTIQMLNAPISLRSTLTKESVEAFPAFARFIDSRYPFVKRMNIDSLSLSGRALSMPSSRPSIDSIVHLVKKIRRGNLLNLDISYHGVDLRRLAYFCSPADLGSTIYISPSDYISLCQENPYPNEKLGTSHIVGTYDANGFPLLNDFRTMSRWGKIKSSKQCKNCAALFFCAGGCKAKIRFSPNGTIEDSDSLYWCNLAKELTPVEIHSSVFRRSLYPNAIRKTCRIGGIPATIVLIR